MTQPRDVTSYGGPYANQQDVEDPTTEMGADFGMRLLADVAELTRTTTRSIVKFNTSAATAPVTLAITASACMAGVGSGTAPVVTKTATGEYSVAYPATFTDEIEQSESNAFTFALAKVGGPVLGFAQTSISGSTINVHVMDAAGAATDLGGGNAIVVFGY